MLQQVAVAHTAPVCKVAAAGDVHAHDDLRIVPFRTKAAEPVCTGDIGLVVALADGIERNVDPLIQQALHVIQIGRQVDVAQHHPAQVNAKALEDLQLLQAARAQRCVGADGCPRFCMGAGCRTEHLGLRLGDVLRGADLADDGSPTTVP